MDKWIISTILYVTLLVGGFTIYENIEADKNEAVAVEQHQGESGNHQEQETSSHAGSSEKDLKHGSSHEQGDSHGHGGDSHHTTTSEVNVYVQADHGDLQVFLKDKAGNPMKELEVNHEKLLHLIIVDEQLKKYHHIHPEPIGNGQFHIRYPLPDGLYKAFVDIKPQHLAYHVSPVPLIVGTPQVTIGHKPLQPDTAYTQRMDGETATLHLSSFKANEPVTLNFKLDQSKLTPYLGAMGHVVILDENAQNFLHVHPTNLEEPVFETEFKQPGIYKIWAEFKQDGKVRAFPYVVEIKGEE